MEIVTVADVDAEGRVRNSLLQIWGLRFGHKSKLLFILSTRSGQDLGERCLLECYMGVLKHKNHF